MLVNKTMADLEESSCHPINKKLNMTLKLFWRYCQVTHQIFLNWIWIKKRQCESKIISNGSNGTIFERPLQDTSLFSKGFKLSIFIVLKLSSQLHLTWSDLKLNSRKFLPEPYHNLLSLRNNQCIYKKVNRLWVHVSIWT